MEFVVETVEPMLESCRDNLENVVDILAHNKDNPELESIDVDSVIVMLQDSKTNISNSISMLHKRGRKELKRENAVIGLGTYKKSLGYVQEAKPLTPAEVQRRQQVKQQVKQPLGYVQEAKPLTPAEVQRRQQVKQQAKQPLGYVQQAKPLTPAELQRRQQEKPMKEEKFENEPFEEEKFENEPFEEEKFENVPEVSQEEKRLQ